MEDGLLDMGKRVVLKLMGVIAKTNYDAYHDEYIAAPMWYVPDSFRNIGGLCNETYKFRDNWLFKETLENVDYFDYGPDPTAYLHPDRKRLDNSPPIPDPNAIDL
jgi:hypothetical protein